MSMRFCRSSPALLSLVLGLSIVPPTATAQVPVARLTLSKALEMAQLHAPAIEESQASVRAADANMQQAGLLPNPTLTVEAENVMGSGRYARFGEAETTYSLSMPLELGGKRAARVRVAQAERAYVGIGAAAAKAELTMRTTQAFIAVAATERRLAAANSALALAQQVEDAARARVRAGKVSPLDEQRAKVQHINAQVKADRIRRNAELATASLARLLDVTQIGPVVSDWFDSPDSHTGPTPQSQSLPLGAADALVTAAGARVDAARRARLPDVAVSVGSRRFRDSGENALVVAVSLPLPIFNTGKAELIRSHAELDRAQAQRNAVVLDTAQALAEAQAQVADAIANASAATGPGLSAAHEAARIARIGYAEGKFSQLDLIEAERTLSETQESAIDALEALHNARARLARLQGSTLPLYTN